MTKTQKTSLVFFSSAPDPDLMNCLSLKKGLNHCILNVCASVLNMRHALLRGRGDESLCAPSCHPNLTRHHEHQRGNRHAGQVCRVPRTARSASSGPTPPASRGTRSMRSSSTGHRQKEVHSFVPVLCLPLDPD